MRIVVVTALKIVVSLISIVMFCLLFLGVILPALNALGNGSHFPAWYRYTLIFPMIYLPYCVVASTKLVRGQGLVISGIIMHLALVVWIVVGVSQSGYGYTNIYTIFLTIAGLSIVLTTLRLAPQHDS
jgi:hypothetical protein